jgi:hypothetical protein
MSVRIPSPQSPPTPIQEADNSKPGFSFACKVRACEFLLLVSFAVSSIAALYTALLLQPASPSKYIELSLLFYLCFFLTFFIFPYSPSYVLYLPGYNLLSFYSKVPSDPLALPPMFLFFFLRKKLWLRLIFTISSPRFFPNSLN